MNLHNLLSFTTDEIIVINTLDKSIYTRGNIPNDILNMYILEFTSIDFKQLIVYI